MLRRDALRRPRARRARPRIGRRSHAERSGGRHLIFMMDAALPRDHGKRRPKPARERSAAGGASYTATFGAKKNDSR